MNTDYNLDSSSEKHFSRVPPCTYFIAFILLKFLSFYNGDHLLIRQLSYIILYIACSLALMLCVDFLREFIKHNTNKNRKNIPKFLLLEKLVLSFKKLVAKQKKENPNNHIFADSTELETDSQEQDKPLENLTPPLNQTHLCDEDGLYTISNTIKHNPNSERKNNNSAQFDNLIAITYFGSQLLLAAFFFLKALKTPYLYLLKIERHSFLHVVVMLFLACAFFLTNKWFLQDEQAKANKTIAGYALVSALISLIFAITLVLSIMFGTTIATFLLWLSKLTLMYLCTITVVCLFLSAIKKQLLSDFNYSILPFMGEKYASTGVFDVLKESTGISLKSLWSLGYIVEILPAILIGCVLLLFLSTSFFVVNSHQKAAVYSLGKLDQSSVLGEGLHFKLPWPIEKVDIFDVSRTKSLQIGYESSEAKDFLWSKTHDGGEYYLLLGNGNELVCVNIKIIYTISDLYSYLTKTAKPEELLSSKAYEIMMERTVTTTLDKLLSIDRSGLSKSVNEELTRYSEELNLGIDVSDVIIESIHPPVEIADVYQNVVNAQIEKNTRVLNAQSSAFRSIADAQLEGKTTVTQAKANQIEKVSDANYEMAVYIAAFEAYNISPASFKLDKYLNTYQKVIGNNKVYVFSPKIDLDLSNYIINNNPDNDFVIVNE